MNSDITNIFPISGFNFLSNVKKEYSAWVKSSDGYIPITYSELYTKIPSGVYKINIINDDYVFVPTNNQTDQLYNFHNSSVNKILLEIEDFWNRIDIYKKYNLVHKRGLMLCGKAGNGKTSIISLLINELIKRNGIIFLVNTVKEFNILYDTIDSIVRKVEPDRPIITVIEDVDKLIDALGTDSEILDFMDGKKSINNHLIILTSNNTSLLSNALLRPSRIDMNIIISDPNKDIRKEFFKNKGVAEDQLDNYVKETEGFSFAELKEVFIGTTILGKPFESVIKQIKNPTKTDNYLNTKTKIAL